MLLKQNSEYKNYLIKPKNTKYILFLQVVIILIYFGQNNLLIYPQLSVYCGNGSISKDLQHLLFKKLKLSSFTILY